MMPAASQGACGVVVLGMGRSGTSTVTGMLHRSGYFLGAQADLMRADEANPTGYFENLMVWRANERALTRLDGAWFDAPEDVEQLSDASDLRRGLRELLDQLLAAAGQRPLALKDPRIGILMSLWWPLLESVLHPVLVLRHPVEVALSLERRDQTALPVALAMWELNLTRTLARLDGRLVTIVHYRDIIHDPELATHSVADASSHLLPELARVVRPELAASVIRPDLYRNRVEVLAGTRWLSARQSRLWQYLKSLPSGTAPVQPPAWTTRASEETRRLTRYENRRQRMYFEMGARLEQAASDLAERDRVIRERQSTLREHRRQLDETLAHVASVEAARAESERQYVEAKEQLQTAEHWLAVVQSSRSWRATEPVRALGRMTNRFAKLGAGSSRPPSRNSDSQPS